MSAFSCEHPSNITVTKKTYPVSGTVNGLAGSGLVLQNNGTDNFAVTGNGTIAFAAAVPSDTAYAITVLAQPADPYQTCIVTNGTGTVPAAPVSNIDITCATDKYSISGTVSGLLGTGLVLRNNGGDDLPIAADGGFTFATQVESGNSYAVTVYTKPGSPAQTCTVNTGSGNVVNAAITSINIICSISAYSVGGTVTGLLGSAVSYCKTTVPTS